MLHRNAQGLTLGLPRIAAAAAGTMTGTLQNPSLLQDLHLNSDQLGLVDAIRVAGQSVMCTGSSMDLRAFAFNAQVEDHRGMAIPLAAQQQVQIDYTLAAGGAITGGVNLEPIDPALVVPVNQLGPALNYCAGFGSVNVAAGADGNLAATVRREVTLGLMGITPTATPEDVTIRSVTINNIELLAGPAGVNGECGVEMFSWANTDNDGCTLGYPARVNDQVEVTLHNYNAGAILCYGGAFVLPLPTPDQVARR